MSSVALVNVTHILPEAAFDASWWFQPFGLDLDKVLDDRVNAEFPSGVDAVGCTANPTMKPFALPPGHPRCALRLMPGPRAGLAALLSEHDGRPALTAVWPFATEGVEHELAVKQVLIAPNLLQAIIVTELRGVMDLAWMDVMFPVDRGFYVEGSRHMVALSGIAHQFKVAKVEPVRVTRGQANYTDVLTKYPEWVQLDGSLLMPTEGMSSIMPLQDAPPGVYSIQGPVKQVRLFDAPMFGREVWDIRMTIARLEGLLNPDVEMSVLLSDVVLNGRPPPRIGDDVNAVIRLQGKITWPNLQAI
jgi:hypothetical protein